MKKTLIYTAMFAAMYTVAYADNPAPTNATTPTTTTSTASAPATTPASATVNSPTKMPNTTTTPATTPSSIPTPQATPVIDCKYRIPAETTTIENNLISTWAGKAVVQSFSFNPATVDDDLTEMKNCYTEQGWQGFNDALQKSGNIEAIKSQHLTVSSQIDGDVAVAAVKDNQWKVTVPLQVVYQNDKEKLTQVLTVDLLIGRKISGDLGIMQMIATPRQTNNNAAQSLPSDNNDTTSPSNTANPSTPTTSTPSQQTNPTGEVTTPAPSSTTTPSTPATPAATPGS